MTEEVLDLVIEDFKKGKNFIIIRNIRAIEDNLPQIRRAVIKKMGREVFQETLACTIER